MWQKLIAETGAWATDAHKKIMTDVICNIQNGKRMQILLGPNASGKTTMACLLLLKLRELGYKAIILQPEGGRYIPQCFHENEVKENELKESIISVLDDIVLPQGIDVIITDSVQARLSPKVDIPAQLAIMEQMPRDQWSQGQKTIKTLSLIQDAFEINKELSVVSFETGNSVYESDYSPIIATSSIFYMNIPRTEEQSKACLDEQIAVYDALNQRLIQQRVNLENHLIEKEKFKQTQACVDDMQGLLIYMMAAVSSNKKSQDEIMLKLDTLERGQEAIKGSLEEVKNMITDLNRIVADHKDFMEICREIHIFDEDEEERLIAKITDKLAESLGKKENALDNDLEYDFTKRDLLLRFGEENWNKMTSDSQRCIISAKYTLLKMVKLDKNFDYSGVCLLVSKALERELAFRFVKAYQQYVVRKKGHNYSQWPGAILRWKEREQCFVPMSEDDFTLGDTPYILGIKRDKTPRRNEGNEMFQQFCVEELMRKIPGTALRGKLAYYDSKIDYIRRTFRNPASHKQPVTCALANECIEYVIEVEAILRSLLSDCSF